MNPLTKANPIIWLCYCTFLAACLAGCARETGENLVACPDLESCTGLPAGWELAVKAGTYEVQSTKIARTGAAALEFGGSGGESELLSNACRVSGKAVIECACWVKASMVRDGEMTVCLDITDGRQTDHRSPSYPVNSQSNEWQRIHFLHGLGDQVGPFDLRLAVRLNGEALIRIDDLTVRVLPQSPANLINDPGFEAPTQDNHFPDWDHYTSSGKGKYQACEDSPANGRSCVRLEGTDEWAVLASRRRIPSTSAVTVQAFVRSPRGVGKIKIDYLKGGSSFASSFSRDSKEVWGMAVVRSEPVLAAKADAVCVSLSASGIDGDYVVDFDDVEVFVER